MARVVWTERASRQLDAARLRIARNSRIAAQRFVERVEAAVQPLDTFPRSGRIAPEVGEDEVRELIVQRHRIVYRLSDEVVEIIMVWHGARLLQLVDVMDDLDSE